MKGWLVFCVCSGICALQSSGGDVCLDSLGQIRSQSDRFALSMAASIQPGRGPTSFVAEDGCNPDATSGSLRIELRGGKPLMRLATGEILLRRGRAGAAVIAGHANVMRDLEYFKGVDLVLRIDSDWWAGSEWLVDDVKVGHADSQVVDYPMGKAKGRQLLLRHRNGGELTFSFDAPLLVSMFDSRKYGRKDFEFRMNPADVQTAKTGDVFSVGCRVEKREPFKANYKNRVVIEEGGDWLPFVYKKDILAGSALDFSRMGLVDAPAGKYGRLKGVGGKFEFERLPGVAQRFYGVNLCGTACAPEKALAEKVVDRFVRLGYNSLRLHHFESVLLRRDGNGFNQEKLDCFDWLVAKALERGLYLTTDLYVSRPVRWKAVGIDREGVMEINHYKALLALGHRGALDDWKTWTSSFLEHRNPYTGRTLAEEPGLITLGLVNEGNVMMGWSGVKGLDFTRKVWLEWLVRDRQNHTESRGLPDDPAKISSGGLDAGSVFARFQSDLDALKVNEMTGFVRGLGYSGLIYNDNSGVAYAAKIAMRGRVTDLVDTHCYIDHPIYLGPRWNVPVRISGLNPLKMPTFKFASFGAQRLYSRPYTVTEWNYASVSSYRSTAGLLCGAIAARQDWDGVWRFAYSHSDRGMTDEGGIVSNFDLAGDPIKQATDRVFSLLYLRRDMPVLKRRVAFELTDRDICPGQTESVRVQDKKWLERLAFDAQVGIVLPEDDGKGADVFPLGPTMAKDHGPIYSPEGNAVTFLPDRRAFAIETPLTCGGFAEAGEKLNCGLLEFVVRDRRATVSASSLDGQPIASSGRLLVLHLTDVQSSGENFADASMTEIINYGKEARPLMHAGKADIGLRLDSLSGYHVFALDTSGQRVAELPTEVRDGRIWFSASVEPGHVVMYYEVQRDENAKN